MKSKYDTTEYTDSFNDTPSNKNTFAYPTKVYDPANNYSEVKYRYDIGANVWAKSPAPAGNSNGKETTRFYDSLGRLEKETLNNNGAYTRYEYPTSNTYSKVYTTITDTNNNNTGDTADEVLAESWTDGAGRTLKAKTPMSFDTNGNPSTWVGQQVQYDSLGRIKKQSLPTEIDNSWNATGDDATRGWQWTEQEFDWKNRIIREIGIDGVDRYISFEGCGCAGGQEITIEGELVPRDDQSGTARRKQKVYQDILGRTYKTEVLDWDGDVYSTVTTEFDGRDNAKSIKKYDGEANSNNTFQEETRSYDGHGRLESQHTPQQLANFSTNYTYTNADQIESMTDGRGASSTYSYDSRGLVSRIDFSLPGQGSSFPTIIPNTNSLTAPDPNCPLENPDYPCEGPGENPPPGPYNSWVTFQYDALGNRTNMTDSETGAVNYNYDQLSRMTSETRTLRSNWSIPTHNFTIGYQYHLTGKLKSVTDPFNDTIYYGFDKLGRLEGISGTPFGSGGNSLVTNYINDIDYRSWGAVKEIEYGNGVVTTQQFDNRLRLSEYKVQKTGETNPHLKKTYQYYDDNRLKSSTRNSNPTHDRQQKYDFQGRLTQALTGAEARNETTIDRNEIPYRQDYTYNAFDNVTSRETFHWTEDDDEIHSWTNNRNSNWDYDVDGRLQGTSLGRNRYYYDARGGMVMTSKKNAHNNQDYSRKIRHLDGDGNIVRFDEYKWRYNQPYYLDKTEYYIYSSVLGSNLTTVKSDGTKVKTEVFGLNGKVAVQNVGNGTTNNTDEMVVWEHFDPSRQSYIETKGDGTINYGTDEYVELDPLGSRVGFDNPYIPIDPLQAAGYGTRWGDPFGGYSCYVDGFQTSCSQAMYMLAIGAAQPNRQFDNWILGQYGYWRDEEGTDARPEDMEPGDIPLGGTTSVFYLFNFLDYFQFRKVDEYNLEVLIKPNSIRNILEEVLKYGDCDSALRSLLKNLKSLSGVDTEVRATDLLSLFDSINSQTEGGLFLNMSPSEANAHAIENTDGGVSISGGGGVSKVIHKQSKNIDTPSTLLNKNVYMYAYAFPTRVSLLSPLSNTKRVTERTLNTRKMQSAYHLIHRIIHELTHVAGNNFLFGHDDFDAAAKLADPSLKDSKTPYSSFIKKHCIPQEYQ